LTRLVDAPTLMLLFAGLMVLVGTFMLTGVANRLSPGHCRPVRCAAIGALVGVLTGFLGVGGGFLIVPALVVFAGVGIKPAIGTSLAIIALNSMSGLLGQLQHAEINWILTALVITACLIGMLGGIALVRRVATSTLQRAFASLLIVLGLVVGGAQLS
jgi:hypothetical protein